MTTHPGEGRKKSELRPYPVVTFIPPSERSAGPTMPEEHVTPSAHETPNQRGASRAEPVEVVLSSEELAFQTQWVPWRTVRIAKRVVTETRTVTVEVRREELVIEDAPVDDRASDARGPRRTGQRLQLVLHSEEVTLGRRVVPAEKVTLTVGTAPGAADITATLAHEQLRINRSESAANLNS